MERLGINRPKGWASFTYEGSEYTFDDEDYPEMTFDVYSPDPDLPGIIVGASHEDVGLVTWYRFPDVASFREWAGV